MAFLACFLCARVRMLWNLGKARSRVAVHQLEGQVPHCLADVTVTLSGQWAAQHVPGTAWWRFYFTPLCPCSSVAQ